MTRSQSLVAALTADTGVTTLVGTRLYPLVGLPPGNGPVMTALIYKIDVDFAYTNSGPGPVDATVEIRSWSAAYETAHAVADAVHGVLMPPAGSPKGFNGLLGGAGGIKVTKCLIDKETEGVVAISPDQFVFEVVSLYGLQYVL